MISEEDFWKAIDTSPADQFVTSEVIDWGGMPKGQGRRRGGMVMGAMSDAVRGKKSYAKILGSAPLNEEEMLEASAMEKPQQVMIARALAVGLPSDVAFVVAYTIGPDPISRHEAYTTSLGFLKKIHPNAKSC